jgi:hypothetical protein
VTDDGIRSTISQSHEDGKIFFEVVPKSTSRNTVLVEAVISTVSPQDEKKIIAKAGINALENEKASIASADDQGDETYEMTVLVKRQ